MATTTNPPRGTNPPPAKPGTIGSGATTLPAHNKPAPKGTTGGGTPAGSGSGGTPTPPPPSTVDPNGVPTTAVAYLENLFPWLKTLGLADQVNQWSIQGLSADQIVANIRNTPQWVQQFPGIKAADGTLKMNEASYMAQRQQYSELLSRYGSPTYTYDQPADFASFFEGDVSPDELDQRFQTYTQVQQSSSQVKAAFYVYAGMNINDDDVYQATVNPDARAQLTKEYEQRVAAGNLDYNTWITRATEFGMTNLVTQLQSLEGKGVTAASPIISTIQGMDPNQARDLAHTLNVGTGTEPQLTLPQLQAAFSAALIGAAATQAGLTQPTFERAQQFRAAGIDHAQALQAYQQIATQQGELKSAALRGGLHPLTQSDFEDALLLKAGPGATAVSTAAAYDTSLTKAGGGPNDSLGSTGNPISKGLARQV